MGPTSGFSQFFLNRLFSWEGPRATLSLSYELISLPVCSRGTLNAQKWLLYRNNQFHMPSAQTLLHSYTVVYTLWPDGPRRHSSQWVGL